MWTGGQDIQNWTDQVGGNKRRDKMQKKRQLDLGTTEG